MISKIINRFRKPKLEAIKEAPKPQEGFKLELQVQNHENDLLKDNLAKVDRMMKQGVHPLLKQRIENISSQTKSLSKGFASDSVEKSKYTSMTIAMDGIKKNLSFAMDNYSGGLQGGNTCWAGIPSQQFNYFTNQSFIGWTTCALMAQHWLISRCCLMPAEDAIRRGYDIVKSKEDEKEDSSNEDLHKKILKEMKDLDIEFSLDYNMVNQIQFGRVFGIRIAIFKVDTEDDDYYYEPFNIDAVLPGSYEGITQVDPYWMSPMLDVESSSDPMAIHFYEPTWWNVAGKMVHRTHMVIYRTEEVADTLKSAYIYGGVPIPQKIYNRVYMAEMISNEIPYLIKTKRTVVVKTNTAAFLGNQAKLTAKMAQINQYWDNHGTRLIDFDDEDMMLLDTSLDKCEEAGLYEYQLVASGAGMTFTQLFGTSPKGWQSTGEYEQDTYRESLVTMQKVALIPLANRHHEIIMKSIIEPKYGVNFKTNIVFKPLDAMTSKELAELNKLKAETDASLSQAGAIDGDDVRDRLRKDPESGFYGFQGNAPVVEADPDIETMGESENQDN